MKPLPARALYREPGNKRRFARLPISHLAKPDLKQLEAQMACPELRLPHGVGLKSLEPRLRRGGIGSALALLVVHHRKLYRRPYGTFTAFSDQKLSLSRYAGFRRVALAKTVVGLLGVVEPNDQERKIILRLRDGQVRMLTKGGSLRSRWEMLRKLSKAGHAVTAPALQAEIRRTHPEAKLPESVQERYRKSLVTVQNSIRAVCLKLPIGSSARERLEKVQAQVAETLCAEVARRVHSSLCR